MKNLLEHLVDKASEEIVEMRTRAMQQITPAIDKVKSIEYPDMKKNFENATKEMDAAKEEMINKVKESGTDFIESIRSDLNDLGVDLGLLTISTADFAVRTALIVPSIITFTAFGPALAPQQSPTLIKELGQEANELSTLYDKVNNRMKKLHLRELGSMMPFNLRRSSPTYPSLNGIMTATEDALAVAKPLILSAGADCDGEKGTPISVELPDYGQDDDINADNCENYSRIHLTYGEADAINCSNYSAMDVTQGRSCSNCVNFIPINVNLKVKGWVYMRSKSFKAETSEGIELSADGKSVDERPRDIHGIRLRSNTTNIESGDLNVTSTNTSVNATNKLSTKSNSLELTSDTLTSTSTNEVSIKSINKGIELVAKEDINYKTEGDIVTESNNTTQTATGSGTLVYDNGMNIVVKNGDSSITTQVGSFTVTTKKDNIFITESNFRSESTGMSEVKSGDTLTITSDAGLNLTVQKEVIEKLLGDVTTEISGNDTIKVSKDRLIEVLGNLTSSSLNEVNKVTENYTREVTGDTSLSSSNYTLKATKDVVIESGLGTAITTGGVFNATVGSNSSIVTTGNFSISSTGYVDVATTSGMQIMSQEEMFINLRSSLTLRVSDVIYEGMYPIPGKSGALNCIATCPFTGVTHWAGSFSNSRLRT